MIYCSQKCNKNGNRRECNRVWAWKQYGIDFSVKEYDELFSKQEGKCKICKKHQSKLRRALCVDHCHYSHKIRGLLCDNCNHALGLLKDDIFLLKSAIKYLKD